MTSPSRVSPLEARTQFPSGVQPELVVEVLQGVREATAVAMVGHEPALSELLSYLLSGSETSVRGRWRKGGVALVELPEPHAGGGELVWYLPPRVLRALA